MATIREPGADATTLGSGGLTGAEARTRLAADGPNRLLAPKTTPSRRRLLSPVTHFFALMLWIAGGLAFVDARSR